MGGSGSKQAQLERYGQLLSSRERQALETTFHDIAGSSDASILTKQQLNVSHYCQHPEFVVYFCTQIYLTGLLYPPDTSERISRGVFLALGGGERTGLDFPNFIQFSSQLLRGSLTQRSQRLHILCTGDLQLLRETLEALLARLCHSDASSSWTPTSPQSLAALVDFLTKPLGDVGVAGGRSLTVGKLESWLASSPVVGRVVDVAFGASLYHRTLASPGELTPEIASLVGHPVREEMGEREELDTQRLLVPLHIPHPTQQGHTPSSSLLSSAALLMINSFLPVEVRGQLYPLFLSGQHGQSFSTLCKGLVGSGPCLLVIRDTGGHVFGGFAAVSWQFGPQFIGELFSVWNIEERKNPLSIGLSLMQVAVSVSCSLSTQKWLCTLPLATTITTCTSSRMRRPCLMDLCVFFSLCISPNLLLRCFTGYGRSAGLLWTVAEC